MLTRNMLNTVVRLIGITLAVVAAGYLAKELYKSVDKVIQNVVELQGKRAGIKTITEAMFFNNSQIINQLQQKQKGLVEKANKVIEFRYEEPGELRPSDLCYYYKDMNICKEIENKELKEEDNGNNF